MPSWTNRRLPGEPDLPAIIELRTAIETAEPSGFPISPERLKQSYLLPRPGWWSDIKLWERDGEACGISEIRISELDGGDRVAYLKLRIHPDESESSLPDAMLDSCERISAEYFGADFQIEASVRQGQFNRIALLERHGYTVDRTFHMMRRTLSEPVTIATLPCGYAQRALRGVNEVRAWLELYENAFQDHYDFHPISFEERIQRMEEPSSLPEFDLVIESNDGSLAAFCMCDCRTGLGGEVDWHIDLIGTHREHRKRGLAAALLTSTMAMVKTRGGHELSLEVDASSSTGAGRLYEQLGFRRVSASIDYRKSFQ